MLKKMAVRGLLTAVAIAAGASSASAQVFGTFTWQMQPYCNIVTLALTSVTGNFTLDGSDDQCGATTKASAVGIGVFNPDGTVGLNFTIVTSPSGKAVHASAIVSPANGQGTWSDDLGNTGTFAFFGSTAGLPARPSPSAHFRVSNLVGTTVPNGNAFQTQRWSATPETNVGGGTYDAAAGTYAVPTAGVYLVTGGTRWNPFTAFAGFACVTIAVNGTSRGTACEEPTSADFLYQPTSTVLALAAGDLITIRVRQISGASNSTLFTSQLAFTVTRLN